MAPKRGNVSGDYTNSTEDDEMKNDRHTAEKQLIVAVDMFAASVTSALRQLNEAPGIISHDCLSSVDLSMSAIALASRKLWDSMEDEPFPEL